MSAASIPQGPGHGSGAVPAPRSRTAAPVRRSRAVDQLIGSPTASESPSQIARRRLKENRTFHFALVLFATIVISCMSAGWFESHWAGRAAGDQNLSGSITMGGKKVDVVNMRGIPAVGPGMHRQYTLGSDNLGRDVFMRILRGGSVSMRIAFGAATIVLLGALMLGTMAGFFKGRIDMVLSRIFDIMLAFPSLVFMIALSTALATNGGIWFIKRGGILMPMFVMGILGISYLARIVRSQVLAVSELEYVDAARALGSSNARIMFHEILPNIVTLVFTYFGILISGAIMGEAGLSFLGVGVLPPTPSWGNIIADGQALYSTAWWIAFMPGAIILATVLSLNLISEALEEAFDPKALGGK